MKRFGLDDITADRLLSGRVAPADAPPGYGTTVDAIQAVANSSSATDAARETLTVAAMVEAVRSKMPAHQPLRRRSMLAQLLSAKVAAIAAMSVLGATAAAAATNTLPAPAQTAISHAASHVGVSVPAPNRHENAHATPQHGMPDNGGKANAGRHSASAGDNAVGPDATGKAKYGLCTAYAAGPSTTNPHSGKNDSVAFTNLQKAADEAGMSVADYCKNAEPPTNDGTTTTTGSVPKTDTTPASNSHAATPGSNPHGRTPPVSTPPVSTPPVSGRPVSTPPVSGPPVSTPPVPTPTNSHRP